MWRDAARHIKQVEGIRMAEYKVKRAQLDALWSNENPSAEGYPLFAMRLTKSQKLHYTQSACVFYLCPRKLN